MQRSNPFGTLDRPQEPTTAELAQQLQRIEQMMARLLVAVSAASGTSGKDGKLSPMDHVHLATLLPAIAGSVGDVWWTVRDLAQAAEHRPRLRAAIEEHKPHVLGQLLRRAEGAVVGGLQVERLSRERNGARRRVVAVR